MYTSARRGETHVLDLEDPQHAATREFSTKMACELDTGLDVQPVGRYNNASRDERNTETSWVETHVFTTLACRTFKITPGTDVGECKWVRVDDIVAGRINLAFDHTTIVTDAFQKIRAHF